LLIPGWATDYRIFNGLDLDYNYLLPVNVPPNDLADKCVEALEANGLEKVNLLGWSMGAFLAQDILTRYPGRVTGRPILVSAKTGYEKDAIGKIKDHLEKNRAGYLYRFYRECCAGREEGLFSSFRKGLFKEFIDTMSLDALLDGLSYLSDAKLDIEALKDADIGFIHGTEDRIAPVAELRSAEERLPKAIFRYAQGSGHMPFYSTDFKRTIDEMCGR